MFACFLFKAILFFFYLLKIAHKSYDAFLSCFSSQFPMLRIMTFLQTSFPTQASIIQKSTEADVNYSDSLQKPVFDIFKHEDTWAGGLGGAFRRSIRSTILPAEIRRSRKKYHSHDHGKIRANIISKKLIKVKRYIFVALNSYTSSLKLLSGAEFNLVIYCCFYTVTQLFLYNVVHFFF